jgi:hypothetical protein
MAKAKLKRLPDLAQDRPIDREVDDRLDRIPFVENLILALVRDEVDLTGRIVARRSTGVVVGLTGKWGSGKSSILNLVSERLSNTDLVAVATLNPWLLKGRDELLSAFFSELRDALGRSPKEHASDLVEAMDRYREAITLPGHFAALAADTAGAAGMAAAGLTTFKALFRSFGKPRQLSPQDERRNLEKKLENANIAVVVLVDELDRVEDDEVRVVAQLVKAIGDIKGISYLVAYDPDRVADALGRGLGEERRRIGEAYLEKIIQHPIPIRPLFTHEVNDLLDALLKRNDLELPVEISEEEKKVVAYLRDKAATPRELKRLVGSYAVLYRMLREEISPADLLGYCWLLTKAPALREYIAHNIDAVVDDPTAAEMAARLSRKMNKEGKPQPGEVLGELAVGHEELLRLMFPVFGSNRTEESGARISRRRNLVRVLYLGDPPGLASSDDVRKLWNHPDEGVLSAELERLFTSGGLRPIIDRLDDLLPRLDEKGDVKFWKALAKTLVRKQDWLLSPEESRGIAEDATSCLLGLGLRDNTKINRVKCVAEALLGDGDLIILPALIRHHLFHWGLTVHNKMQRNGDFIFTQEETQNLIGKSLPIFSNAVRDETILRRIPNCEAIWALSNSGNWGDCLRQSLTFQLSTKEARATFAALIVPPGYSADRSSLALLFDVDAVLSQMRAANEGANAETWSEQCLWRLRAILAGRDPMFAGDGDDADQDEEPGATA